MTLREFNLAVSGYKANLRKEYYQTGLICTMIARLGGNKQVKPEDFVPKERKPEMSSEQMEKTAEFITKMLGGEVRK